jgi:predicted nucleic acid-binding protein
MLINLDANIVIHLLDSSTNSAKIEDIIRSEIVSVTPITVHIVWYFYEKKYLKCTKKKLLSFFDSIEILPMSKYIYKKALLISKQDDIEDGMQIACCIENNVELILTGDGPMYSKYAKKINIKLIK